MQPVSLPAPSSWLPKGKISWTQIDLAINNPKEYYERYFLNLKQEEPDHLIVGKIFHSIPLNPKWKEEMEEKGVKAYIKTCEKYADYAKLPNQEQGVSCTYESNFGSVEIIGYFDGYESETEYVLHELKTSPYKIWDKKRLQESGQFKLYSLIFYSIFGVIPEVRLKSFKLTQDPAKSRMAVLVYTPKLRDVLAIQQKIDQALEIIYQLYEAHKNQTNR